MRKKIANRVEGSPLMRKFLSKEKRKALDRTDLHHGDESKNKWDRLLANSDRKSFVKAMQSDPRTDDKLGRHVDQMNRLQTGKKVGQVGQYDIVRKRGGGLGCTCPDWRYKRSVASEGQQDCKHIKEHRKTNKTAGISIEDVHRRADKLGIAWDSEKPGSGPFLKMSKKVTGKPHLDDMNSRELMTLHGALPNMMKEKTAHVLAVYGETLEKIAYTVQIRRGGKDDEGDLTPKQSRILGAFAGGVGGGKGGGAAGVVPGALAGFAAAHPTHHAVRKIKGDYSVLQGPISGLVTGTVGHQAGKLSKKAYEEWKKKQ